MQNAYEKIPVEKDVQELDTELLRLKLSQAAEMWSEKIPDMMQQAKGHGVNQMMLMSFQPFLPTLQRLLVTTIEDMDDRNLLELVQGLDHILDWMKTEYEHAYDPAE
jgi:hypothetical protein